MPGPCNLYAVGKAQEENTNNIEFARMDNGRFQERVFSTVGNAQSSNQGRMMFDHLEKRAILAHNKALIKDGVI